MSGSRTYVGAPWTPLPPEAGVIGDVATPECLVCNRPSPEWGLCHDCRKAADRSRDVEARAVRRCPRCGSVFTAHTCLVPW